MNNRRNNRAFHVAHFLKSMSCPENAVSPEENLENGLLESDTSMSDLTASPPQALSQSFVGMDEKSTPETPDVDRRMSTGDLERNTGRPSIELTMHRLTAGRSPVSLSMFKQVARPLSPTDLQSFILYACFGPSGSFKPIWCRFRRWRRILQVCTVIVQGVSDESYQKHKKSCFIFLDGLKHKILATPSPTFVEDLFSIPLTPAECIKKSNSAFPHEKEHVPIEMPLASAPVEASRVQLLMRMVDMVESGYDLPIPGSGTEHYVYSKDTYRHVTDRSPVFALDCEMCVTDEGHELTRISIVDEDFNIVLDQLVKPDNTIRDYVTQFSGITPALLQNVTLRLPDIQAMLKKLLPPDAILIGHSINFDFRALKLFHPFVMDIAVLYNLSGMPLMRSSLSTLAEIFLNECVQNSKSGHCSIEDALVTMRLAKLKLQNGHVFGNARYGWDCTEFLARNPRPRVGDPLAKRSREAVSRPCSPRPATQCASCRAEVQIFCTNSQCLCAELSWSDTCWQCHTLPNVDATSTKTVECREIFKITLGGKFENVFDFFERNKKSLLWVSGPLHSTVLDAVCADATLKSAQKSNQKSKKKSHKHEASIKKRCEIVREQGLEYDFVLAEMGLTNSSNCVDCVQLDSGLKEIYDGLVSNSLFCVLLQDCGSADSAARFFFKIKP